MKLAMAFPKRPQRMPGVTSARHSRLAACAAAVGAPRMQAFEPMTISCRCGAAFVTPDAHPGHGRAVYRGVVAMGCPSGRACGSTARCSHRSGSATCGFLDRVHYQNDRARTGDGAPHSLASWVLRAGSTLRFGQDGDVVRVARSRGELECSCAWPWPGSSS